ncbi:MAG TPA: ergothioneine biosynthesis protein EgtB [Thermoanaerobaculia bacterium]
MDRRELADRYRQTRETSVRLCQPLRAEDYRVQSMPDVSPPWWNLGHTTWFFAKNVLEPFGRYRDEDARLEYPLNSYYESLGPRLARDHRGQVTRPTTDEIYRFRASVDERIAALIEEAADGDLPRIDFLITTGIQHEQQHQELLVTEIKHILGTNVPELREPYRQAAANGRPHAPAPLRFVPFAAGLYEFGNVEGGWCWDNEVPVHRAYLDGFALASRLVTNGEYLEFIADGGYRNPLLWLANGWAKVKEGGWTAPLYWERQDGGSFDRTDGWRVWTLAGLQPLALDEPVAHASFYEADAYARWKAQGGGDFAGARLPTEREWEQAARLSGFRPDDGNYLESGLYHPRPAILNGDGPQQLGGDLWEWTTNHYEPYPGYQPFDGNLMEYNGKFMDNQRVLRGGSCATPGSHIRASYRNFWPADTRFQFTGIRLAKGV